MEYFTGVVLPSIATREGYERRRGRERERKREREKKGKIIVSSFLDFPKF